MCLSGPPGSTVAGRDGADGTNNNRGSVPCGANHNLDPNSGNINTVLGNSGTGDNAGSAADESACCKYVAQRTLANNITSSVLTSEHLFTACHALLLG